MINNKKRRWLPSGHPDIQKKIDEVKAKAKMRKEQPLGHQSIKEQSESCDDDIMDTPLE